MSGPYRRMPKTVSALFTALLIALSALATPALAAWPERPITLIVPWSAGDNTIAVPSIAGNHGRRSALAPHRLTALIAALAREPLDRSLPMPEKFAGVIPLP